MNGAGAAAISCQRLDRLPRDPAQSVGICGWDMAREGGPAYRAKRLFTKVAACGERRGYEINLCAGPSGAVILGRVVHR